MNNRLRTFALFTVFTFSLSLVARETWMDTKQTCPICKHIEYYSTVSRSPTDPRAGNARYQYIFWPYTADRVLHPCPNCKMCVFMWDWKKIPADKYDAVKTAVSGIKFSKAKDYRSIPMTERMAAAEKTYKVLGKDDRFWCDFYRLKGYWLEVAGKKAEAKVARKRALDLGLKLLKKERQRGKRKELFYICGAMIFFNGNKNLAHDFFKKVKTITYEIDGMDMDEADREDRFINSLASFCIQKIEAGKEAEIPRK